MKRLTIGGVLLVGTIFSSTTMATTRDFDFNDYQGTITRLGLLPAIGSGYSLVFKKVANPTNYKFVTYTADTHGNLTPTYYTYTHTLKMDAVAIKKSQLNNAATIDNANGYYFGLMAAKVCKNRSGSIYACGGGIYNTGTISNGIIGDFIGNYATSADTNAYAGAIYNKSGTIGNITGDFIGNYATADYAYGGAIYNDKGSIGNINGNFIGNYTNGSAGAIYNLGSIGDITGNYIGNYAFSIDNASIAGAIYNLGHIDNIKANFIGNYVSASKGSTDGGAIFNKTTIGNITGKFIGNYANGNSAFGGAISNFSGTIDNITANFIGNYANGSDPTQGGAIYNNNGTLKKISGNFIGNHASSKTIAQGGAIYSNSTGTIGKILNSSFINNYAKGKTDAKGGAIYSRGNILIEANNGVSEFTGNYVEVDGVKTSSAIYMATADTTLAFNSFNSGTIIVNDTIDGVSGYSVLLTSDKVSSIIINGDVKNANIIVDGYNTASKISTMSESLDTMTVNFATADILNHNNNLSLSSGITNILKFGKTTLHLNILSLSGGLLNINNVGVDLQSKEMGKLEATTTNGDLSDIAVKSVDVESDALENITNVNFAKDNLIANKVANEVTKSMGPVFNYDVSYNKETGNFTFVRKDVNPDVLVPSVAAVAAVSVLSDEIYSRALADADKAPNVFGCSRAVSNAWVKTFGSDDSVDLKGFSGAETRFDGIIAGIGSGRISEGRGVSATYNIYAAYANGESKFADEKIVQDAYYLGVGANFYKGKAFIGTTANVAMVRNRADTFDGKDKFSAYVGGVAAKMGYNFDVAGLIVQPNLYASYTHIDSNDYTTGRGAKVEMNSMSNIELAPGLKVEKKLADGMGVYAKTRYVHTFNEAQKAYANGFLLPEISLKPYVEYGLGVEKSAGSYSGFAEIMRRDGGREGWNGLIGLKYNF